MLVVTSSLKSAEGPAQPASSQGEASRGPASCRLGFGRTPAIYTQFGGFKSMVQITALEKFKKVDQRL